MDKLVAKHEPSMDRLDAHRAGRLKHELLAEVSEAARISFLGLSAALLAADFCMKVLGMDLSLEAEVLMAAGGTASLAITKPFGRLAIRHSQRAEDHASSVEEHDPLAYV